MCKNKSPGVPGLNINCERDDVVKGLEHNGLKKSNARVFNSKADAENGKSH